MIYKVKKDFKYNPHNWDVNDKSLTTEFHKGELYEFEPYTDPTLIPIKQQKTKGEMQCKTKLYPDCNNGFTWDEKFFNEHFEEVKDTTIYPNDHNFLFGHTVNKLDDFDNSGQDYITNLSASDIYHNAIENALQTIDKYHKLDMNNILAQYNLANTSKNIFKQTLKQLLENYSEENIEKAKFVLENIH